MPDLNQVNQDPLNQAVLPWLRKVKVPVDNRNPHLLTLAWWALEEGGVLAPGVEDDLQADLQLQVGMMLAWKPLAWMNWLLSNPEMEADREEQEQSLLGELQRARSPRQAASRVLETIADNLKSQIPTFRPAASEG